MRKTILIPVAALTLLRVNAYAGPTVSVSSSSALLPAAVSSDTVAGRGGNYSVPLPDGRVLWLLNNVWIGEAEGPGVRAVWSIVDGAAAVSASSDPYSQGKAAYVADENNWPLPLLSGDIGEYSQLRKFWPRSGLCAGGRCFAFYSVMNNHGPDAYDYFRVGQGVAWADKPEGPYKLAAAGGRGQFWNDVEPAFGSALLQDGEWVYVYGHAMTTPGEHAVKLARVKPSDLASADKYFYYSAGASSASWTTDLSEAASMLDGLPEEFSVSYNEALEAYLAVYSDPLTGGALAKTAPFPWGPWGEPFPLVACAMAEFCYGAKEQPGFASAGGRKIFLTVEKKNVPYLYEVKIEPGD